jgi:hypothetical protein
LTFLSDHQEGGVTFAVFEARKEIPELLFDDEG